MHAVGQRAHGERDDEAVAKARHLLAVILGVKGAIRLLLGPRGSAKGVMPVPAPAVPDLLMDAGHHSAPAHDGPRVRPGIRRLRTVAQASNAAPAKAASARSSPRWRPARPARASTTCSATRRRPDSLRPETAKAHPRARPRSTGRAHPALARRRADGGAGAHAAADGDAGLAASVRFERQGDRPGAVPAPASQAQRKHHQDRLARRRPTRGRRWMSIGNRGWVSATRRRLPCAVTRQHRRVTP